MSWYRATSRPNAARSPRCAAATMVLAAPSTLVRWGRARSMGKGYLAGVRDAIVTLNNRTRCCASAPCGSRAHPNPKPGGHEQHEDGQRDDPLPRARPLVEFPAVRDARRPRDGGLGGVGDDLLDVQDLAEAQLVRLLLRRRPVGRLQLEDPPRAGGVFRPGNLEVRECSHPM